jgi:acetyl esterase
MLDPDIAKFAGEPQEMPPLTPDLVPLLRANMAMMAAAMPGADVEYVEDFDADGVPVRLYRPTSGTPLPLLVFLHGGGWMFGDLDTHDSMTRHLAAASGCAVLGVGYRLAPEHKFPAGLDDAMTAIEWARRSAERLGCDPARIALGGESAGGNLTAAATLRLRDEGKPQPRFQLLIHPATDLSFSLPSFAEVAAPGLSKSYLDACREYYLGDVPESDPLASPLRAESHADLAPAIVLTASEDPLRDDGEYYAAALVRAGVETLAQRLPGLPHGFQFLPITIPAVRAANDLIGGLVRRYFAAT